MCIRDTSGIQGICPNGWHLPSKAEWKKLENFVADELAPVEGNVWTDDEGNVLELKDALMKVMIKLYGNEAENILKEKLKKKQITISN